MRGASAFRTGGGSGLLSRSPDAGQISRHALVEAHDALRELVHRGDQGQSDGRHNQGVLDEVLPLLILNKTDYKCFHGSSSERGGTGFPASVRETSNGPTNSLKNPAFQRSQRVPLLSCAGKVAGCPSKRDSNSRFLRAAG